ncbi:MAG: toast rack family protein [Chloroflexota bacterium]
MKTKQILFFAAASLALASLACGVTLTLPEDAIDIGPLESETISVSVPHPGETTSVLIQFGAGDLFIHPGAPDALITGLATYNVDGLQPEVSTSGEEVSIKQDTFEYNITGLPNYGDVENTWDLYFNASPLELEVRTGAVKGEFEFGGMAVQELKIFTGASTINLAFSSPNLTPMSQFRYTTGASSATLTGLSNANFSLMNFQGGVGSYTLDFSGVLQRDATVEADAALSNMTINIPPGIPAVVNVEGTLNNVVVRGNWGGAENTYSLAGSGPTLVINVKIGAGNLNLTNE